MKTIQSIGGPLIGLDHDVFHLWNGIAGKKFVGESSPFLSDYDAVCNLTNTVGKLIGGSGEGLVIAMPFETTIIDVDKRSIYIAQVEYAEPSWSFSHLDKLDFNKAKFDPIDQIQFSAKASTYVFFDSSYPANDVGEDYISVEIEEGRYVLSFALYDPDPLTNLLFYRITKE